MIDKFLKIAGVNNIDDFYKLHPTEEHFFKSYPNAKKQMDKKLSKAAYGGNYAKGGGTGSSAVKKYQEMLNKKYGAGLATDGMWGPKTQAAYEKFITYRQEAPIRIPTKYATERQYGIKERPSKMGELEVGTDITPLPTIMSNDRVIGMRLNRQQPYSYPVEPETDLMPLPTVMGNEGYGNGMRMGQPQIEEIPRENRIYRGRPANPQYDEETYRNGGYYQDGGETNQQQQIMQIIQAYAEVLGQDPRELIAQLQQLQPEEQQAAIQSMMEELQKGQLQLGETEQQEFARGGGIYINPSKKGTFTAQATRMGMSVKEAARHILANKDKYTPKIVKKANFARNASNWKHEDGGYAGMYQEGGEAMSQEMMEGAPQQMQEQAIGQEQQPQQGDGQDQMMQQLAQMVAQALQQGMQPEQIMEMLVKQGVPQEVAMQVIQMVMQQMQGGAPGQQYQPQGGEYQGPQGQQPMAAMGGYYANGGINNPGFRALPSYVQQKIMNNMAYGGHYDNGGYFNESYMPFDY